MIRAELRLGSDGVQYLAPIYDDRRLVGVLAGPLTSVLGALPDFKVEPENVEGLTAEMRPLWGVRKERTVVL